MRGLPGTQLLVLARLVVDPAAVERVLEPLVADWQREWLAADTALRRSLVRSRGCITFIYAAAYSCAVDEMPSDVRRRAWITVFAFVGFGTFVGLGTFVLAVPTARVHTELMVYLLPSTLALSVPLAILPLAILLGTSVNRSRSRRYLARCTLITASLVFALYGWVTPYANQTFRKQVTFSAARRAGNVATYRPPRPGVRELTLSELFFVHLSTPDIASPSKVREEINSRIALPLVPLVLAILGWSLARVSSSVTARRLVGWWIFACVTFGFSRDLGMTLERSWSVPREVAVWLPLVLWSVASVVLARSAQHTAGGSEDLPLPTWHRSRTTTRTTPGDKSRHR